MVKPVYISAQQTLDVSIHRKVSHGPWSNVHWKIRNRIYEQMFMVVWLVIRESFR